MSSKISFKHLHVYTLRKSLGNLARPQQVLLITNAAVANRHHQRTVSVLPLSAIDRRVETEIRVKVLCRREGGSAELDATHYVAIDGALPMEKRNLILASATEILEVEKREVLRKLGMYLGI